VDNAEYQDPGVRSKVPAGVVDAGFASLATFAAGLVAVNILSDADRGVYAVYFGAFTLGAIIAYQLVYVPAEIEAVARPLPMRITIIDDSLRIGRVPAIVGAMVILGATLTTAPYASARLAIGLTVTACIATYLSPTQDHLRRTLHIVRQPWSAAWMSVTQFVVTVASLGVMMAVDVGVEWIPFGSLAIANTISMFVGHVLIRRRRRADKAPGQVSFRALYQHGRWLVVQAVIPAFGLFVVANIITYLAGPEAMGYAEGARITAQPILVMAGGFTSALRPRVMEAAMARDFEVSWRVEKHFILFVVLMAGLYLPLVAGPWAWNPMYRLVPAAYEISGLAAAAIVANTLLAVPLLIVNELFAAGRAKAVATIEAVAVPIGVVAATSAVVLDAYAWPLARSLGAIGALVGLMYGYRLIYGKTRRSRQGAQSEAPAG
jgi:hypothetical protein